jgi:hypothetical protein
MPRIAETARPYFCRSSGRYQLTLDTQRLVHIRRHKSAKLVTGCLFSLRSGMGCDSDDWPFLQGLNSVPLTGKISFIQKQIPGLALHFIKTLYGRPINHSLQPHTPTSLKNAVQLFLQYA